ncbi:hypothetical protein AcV5_001923 [Taiwanofungus camphoratus]|nr:hypothetical protein AcV5_001923 [Antrodia cinnamomea]
MRASAITSDIIAVAVIWYHTRPYKGHTGSLQKLLLRDGAIYFIFLSLFSVLTIVTYITHIHTLATFVIPVPSLIISRCLLNVGQLCNSTDEINPSSIIQTGYSDGFRTSLSSLTFTPGIVDSEDTPVSRHDISRNRCKIETGF